MPEKKSRRICTLEAAFTRSKPERRDGTTSFWRCLSTSSGRLMMLFNQVHPDVVASDALSLALSPRTQPAERGVESPNADMFPRAFRACSGGFRFMVWLLVQESETCWPAAVILRSQLPPVGSLKRPYTNGAAAVFSGGLAPTSMYWPQAHLYGVLEHAGSGHGCRSVTHTRARRPRTSSGPCPPWYRPDRAQTTCSIACCFSPPLPCSARLSVAGGRHVGAPLEVDQTPWESWSRTWR